MSVKYAAGLALSVCLAAALSACGSDANQATIPGISHAPKPTQATTSATPETTTAAPTTSSPTVSATSAPPAQSSSPSTSSPSVTDIHDAVFTHDSLGPVTVGMTVPAALATGLLVNPPSPCTNRRLDPKGTVYASDGGDTDGDGVPDQMPTSSLRGAPYIMVGENKTISLITTNPGGGSYSNTEGITTGKTTLAQLKTQYGDSLLSNPKGPSDYYKITGTNAFEQFTITKGVVAEIGVKYATDPEDLNDWIDGLGGLC
jgi:hypothetical protein